MKEDVTEYTGIATTLARLEGKLDASLAGQAGRIDVHSERIRGVEEQNVDHESRLRTQEARRTISPKQLWAGLGASVGAMAAGTAIINTIAPMIVNK
ncbi:hypothetical protein ISF9_006 [Microbacterium phage vB_MoxS-ISF9]|uniref:Uncharacterized protein n=1 Tax=Microbacterium phage vB_MoxS-ISF9 TaxID=1458670 RepID=W8PF46_9CAUD|nr:hypothetical protein ISF9_006 [Microbacterium phage vB_MoxS-ISF9]AHL18476.1 hypothetical protein ISF9_006 [Microbacterium phage vB_MoxS-ISF9]